MSGMLMISIQVLMGNMDNIWSEYSLSNKDLIKD